MSVIWQNAKMLGKASLLSALLALAPSFAQTVDWKIDTVDTSGAGKFASLQFDEAGNGHLAYAAEDGYFTLKYGFWDVALQRWFIMPVARGAAFTTLVLDSKQHPQISYTDAGSGSGAKLRYARWDGKTWKTDAVPLPDDVISYYTSIFVDKNDAPTISFYEYEGPRGVGFLLKLRAVTLADGYWQERTIDPAPGSGKFNSIAIGSDGQPQAAYANVKDENASLRYASWDGKTWKKEIIEGQNQTFYVYSVALALDKQNAPHIAYTDVKAGEIKYATKRDNRWRIEVADVISKEAYPDRNGITLDDDGNPYISYYDAGAGALKMAHKAGGRWVVETVDSGGAGFTSSIQIRHGQVWIVYADEAQHSLKCARRPIGPASAAVAPQVQSQAAEVGKKAR